MYTPHESVMSFVITVHINATNATTANATAAAISSVSLTPAKPRALSTDKRVSAALVGDLLPFRAFPVLTSQRLLMPSLSGTSQLRPADWMLVDPSMLTLDGSECNKIGVGFSAFKCEPRNNIINSLLVARTPCLDGILLPSESSAC